VREVINQIDAVELTTEASTTTPTAGAPTAGEAASGPTPEELARAERLAVWRERAAATD